MYKKTSLLILFLFLFTLNVSADLIIDDFEQNNGWKNTLSEPTGDYSGGTGPNSSSWSMMDVSWGPKNGSYHAAMGWTNYSTGWVGFASLISNNPPVPTPYRDMSDNYVYYKCVFWIRAIAGDTNYPGPTYINNVRLEGPSNYTVYGTVPFKDYNDGTNEVSTNWKEIIIPISDFTNDTAGGFSLSSVRNFVIQAETPSTGFYTGYIYIDDIKIVSGVEITTTDSSNLATKDNDENYMVDLGIVRIMITERSNKTGLTGLITISPTNLSGVYLESMTDNGNGTYYFDWNTTGKNVSSYTVECILYNTYATDYNGLNDTGPDLIITLTPLNPPSTPTGLTAIAVSYDQIELVWNDVDNETSYTLFKNTVNDTNTAISIAGLSANQTNYIDTGLTPDTTYYYWVKAYNTAGSSNFSAVASNTTFSLPKEKEPEKTGLTIWNNYITEENQYIKIFIKSPAPEKYADENISVKVYTLNGVLVKEIINTPYKQISNPIIWDCEVNGEKLQNGVYIIMIKGAGIDEYKRIYIAK